MDSQNPIRVCLSASLWLYSSELFHTKGLVWSGRRRPGREGGEGPKPKAPERSFPTPMVFFFVLYIITTYMPPWLILEDILVFSVAWRLEALSTVEASQLIPEKSLKYLRLILEYRSNSVQNAIQLEFCLIEGRPIISKREKKGSNCRSQDFGAPQLPLHTATVPVTLVKELEAW
jgi:hypothetical protein